jgi:alanine-glyoxylate transaminase/serine-glyoxylate transaminase/serine-pyruvate transaminase
MSPPLRLITVNTIKVPEGVDWAAVVKNAMDKFNLEIAGGLGPTIGKVWRVSAGWIFGLYYKASG